MFLKLGSAFKCFEQNFKVHEVHSRGLEGPRGTAMRLPGDFTAKASKGPREPSQATWSLQRPLGALRGLHRFLKAPMGLDNFLGDLGTLRGLDRSIGPPRELSRGCRGP